MNREIYPKVKMIINQSVKEAKSFDDVKIKPEHLILCILQDKDNEAVMILKKAGFDISTAHDLISDSLRKNVSTPRLASTRTIMPFSEDLKTIIKNSDKECEKLNDNMIDTTHILLSTLLEKSQLTDIFAKLGMNYVIFKKVMNNMRNDNVKNSSYDADDISGDDEIYKRKPKQPDSKTKTPVLDNFCRDLSKAVEKGEIDPVIGREKEIKRVSQILSRRKKRNPILAGSPGVGKTAILEGLAQLIHSGNAPRTLLGKRIFALDLASIVAGTKYRGQFEERMKAVLEECKTNPDIILFIDEMHTIVGAGNSAGSLDASNIFKPALARGEIQVIGATTLDEFRENIEKDAALTRRFQLVVVEEPNAEDTKTILMNIKEKYEKHHKVIYTNEAIDECVKLSARYIMDRAMPDKAIDVLDEAGAATNVNIEKPDNLKQLEARKVEINNLKKEVVVNQKYEEAAKLRDEEKKILEELRIATEEWMSGLDKKITTVGVELISEVVSIMTGIPLSKISTQESKKLMNLDKKLMGKVIGQDAAVIKVIKAIKRNRIGIKDKSKPQGSFIFLGKTGVGKSLFAKLLAERVFGDPDSLIRMDMSEYMEKHSVSRLIGPPPGYVGYEQGGQLTEKVRRKPHCVVLFDEIEKAHEDVFNVLLQLLDEGHLTDGLGRKVNFKNTLIIMTSNIGVKEVSSFGKTMGFQTASNILIEESRSREIIEKALKKKFKPEFLNRIDEAIVFNSLSEEDIHKIITLEINKLEERITELNFKLKISKESIEFLGKIGYDETYGARPLNRAIQHYIEDPIADEILNGNINEGETINITFNKEKQELIIKPSKTKGK